MRYVVFAMIMIVMTACGRKPEGLLPPDTAGITSYPQVYPKPLPGEQPPVAPGTDYSEKYTARPDQSLQ